jgi:hypothetical protein
MSSSAFAAVLGPVPGSTAPAKGGGAEARPTGDEGDFAAALNDATANEAPARPTSGKSPKSEPAVPIAEGVETETGATALDGLATVPDATLAVPVAVSPIPVLEASETLVAIQGAAGAETADDAVPLSAPPSDETPETDLTANKAVDGSGEGGAVTGSGTAKDPLPGSEAGTNAGAPASTSAEKLAADKAAQAIADRLLAEQKVVAQPASDRAREVAALQSAVLTPVRPAKSASPAEPLTAPVEAAAAPVEGDEVQVAPADGTPAEPVRVRDVIDRAVAGTGNGAKATDVEASAAPVAPGSADPAATPPSAKPGSSPTEAAALPVAPPVSAEEPTTASPAPAAPTAAETRAAEAADTPGLSTLSRTTIETTAQIAAQIVRKLEGRSTRFEMALTPEGLGRVDISLDIEADGALRATLAFDNPVAATDLRGRADELRRQLLDAGFTLADDALSFAERDPTAGQGSGFDRSTDRHNARAFGAASRLSAEADLSAQPARWINLSLTPAGVDMKV